MSKEIGIINEIGDIGLGFRPLSESDAKTYSEATKPNTEEPKTNNENNK